MLLTAEDLSIPLIFSTLLIFARIGTALMMMPGIGETYINARSRLILALSISFLISPIIIATPKIPGGIAALFLIFSSEIGIGAFLGIVIRIWFSVMHLVGTIISSQSGLSMVMLFDPSQSKQGSVIGNFLGLLSLLLMFLTDLHHLIIKGFAQSYNLFPFAKPIMIGDISQSVSNIVIDMFNISLKIVAPQISVSIFLLLSAGVLSRIMPAMQIFFLITPIQLILSFVILMVTLSTGMIWYMHYLHDRITVFFG